MEGASILSFMTPIILFSWCCTFWGIKMKNKNATTEELKNFYWLKNSNGNEKIEEKNYNIQNIILEVVCVGTFIFLFLAILRTYNIYNFLPLKTLISGEAFWNILEINIEILTVISLVIVLRKEYYLGISVKEVMKKYRIPDYLIKIVTYSIILFMLYGIYNISPIRKNGVNSIWVELWIYSIMLLILVNLMILIYKTISICVNGTKKEMKTFKCLRYKIAFEYQLKQDDLINSSAVEKISTYLVNEIQKYYKSFRRKADKLVEVQYYSTILLEKKFGDAKKYNKKLRKVGIALVSGLAILLFSCSIFTYIKTNEKRHIEFFVVEIIITLFVVGMGAVTNVWNIFVANRSFFVFRYGIEGEERTNYEHEEIAAFGFCIRYNKRYEFIGAIEDLISFYKILLHNQQGERVSDIVIRKVKEKINKEEDEKIRNTILLLLYYFDYEKCYLESESKVGRKINEKNKEEKIREKTIKKIKRKNIYDYEEMKTWIKHINQESAEYQLADSILKEVYKESEIKKNGTINPEKLRNYKFEYYFEFIRSKVGETKSVNNIMRESKKRE